MGRRFSLKIVDVTLKKLFFRLGVAVGTTPGYFIIVPLLLTGLCASGFQRMQYVWDPEYLFSPTTGPAKMERAAMEESFPIDYDYFQPTRVSRVGKFGRMIVTAADDGSLLRSELWADLIYLEDIVYNVTAEYEGLQFQYEDLCARWAGYCRSNEILNLVDMMPEIETGQINLTYPITFDPATFQQYNLPAYFGGFKVSDIGTVEGVEAVSLTYFLDQSEEWQGSVGLEWERNFLRVISEREEEMPSIVINRFVSGTPAWEMERSKDSITPNLLISISFMVIFCLSASTMSDSVRSKPLIGFLGFFTSVMAVLAGFGLACYLGIEFQALNLAAPFLLLGIGVDDTFVMLSAWRRSPTHATVPERMGLAYSDAAVSITVTSLTDFLSFFAGVITPFPCVRIFCIYTGTAVAFIYVWQLTFFGACLALSGFAERKNLHGMFCVPATPKSLASNRSWLYRVFCTGGVNTADPYNPLDNRDHAGMVFLRDKLGYALSLKWVKSLVLIVFTAYLVVAVWGITNLKEGLEKRNTVNFDSYSIPFFDADDKYYMDYRYPINVVLTNKSGTIDFSVPGTQARVEEMMRTFENSTFIKPDMTTSWLRDFLAYVESSRGYDDSELRVGTEAEFVSGLRDVYLADQESPLQLDVKFTGERIEAGRFLLQGFKVESAVEETAMVTELRRISQKFSEGDLEVTVFHPYFIYIDQYLEILPQSIQSVLVTSAFMMVVSFILIPNPVCSLWVAFSIMSIEAGVVGYMTWWNVNLDGVALINLIMCIGFSVDFSAHICYHYMSEDDKTPEERIAASLYALGMPIVQGAVSTILGVIGLAFAPSYLYITFFKMVFLVIFLGAVHGLILLPVLLSLFGPGSCRDARPSAPSTPSTTVSCHSSKLHGACYTVSLGPRPPGATGPGPEDHFQRPRPALASPRLPAAQFRPGQFAFLPEGLEKRPVELVRGAECRLPPVPESREPDQLKAERLQTPHRAPLEQQEHRKIGRSKSHRPRTHTGSGDRQQVKERNVKPPLRKYNSFPYHMFMNEGGYSSDESIKSAFSPASPPPRKALSRTTSRR